MPADTCTPNSEADHGALATAVPAPTTDTATTDTAEQNSAPAVETAEPAAGPACSNCGSTEPWGAASWCPCCGYYPAFNTCVDTGPRQDEPAEAINFLKVFPQWVWVLAAGIVAIFALSLTARLSLPPTGSKRLVWTLLQMAIASVSIFVAHLTAFLSGVPESEKASPFDLFMKPVELWKPALRKLPRHAWRVWCMAWGLWGMFCAVVLVGGVRYSAIFDDWGFEKRASVNVVQAIVDKARDEAEEGAESLDGAVKDFVGEEEEEKDENEELDKLPQTDCLILGYIPNGNGGFSSLLVASVVGNQLRYVGSISVDDIPAEERAALYRRMHSLEQSKPFVKTDMSATWLKPVLMCRVAYKQWTKSQQLDGPRFREMLKDVSAR